MEPKELREAGLKVTLPRMRILEMLERSATRHLSAEDLYRMLMDQGEDIGLATVYRVLTQFEAAGLVMRHHFEGGHAVFEMQQPAHHDHIVCMRCGKVDEFVDEMIERRQKQKAAELGFKLSEHSLIMYGECLKGEACPNWKKGNRG
ncbi:MAG TPA: ferric iron uptake transcriptional regulator [Verrucomicrobiae bacterium]|nr:ferric iron uptake transcriptional regulator [Verrucomicrobiae bacterium]